MRANYKNTIKKLSGNTSDIVSVVMETYNKDWHQVKELARTFGGSDIPVRDICKNIFNYIIENVQYKEDPPGVQWVKTPARFLADGVGDCKSMSIFTASCLRALGIDHFFRFVSFNKRKEATHVYVVALLPPHEGRAGEGLEIIVDPVVRPVQFNKEEKYTYKSDMRGTDIYYLSGINRGIAAPAAEHVEAPGTETVEAPGTEPVEAPGTEPVEVWFGENPDDYSKHKMNLLSFLDLKLSESGIAKTTKELAGIYNELDILSLAVYACENATDKDDLANYFRHIASMKLINAFDNSFTDLEARSRNLAALKTTLQSRVYSNEYFSYDADLFGWFYANCLDHYEESISGIGAVDKRQEIATNMKKGGLYYIYTFIPASMEARYPVRVLRKKQIQKSVYDWVDETDGYNSSQIQANLVRSGIIAKTGKTPEEFLSGHNLKTFRIGEPLTITAILGIVTALISLIKLIWEVFGNKRPEPTEQEINNGLSNFDTDFGSASIPEIKPAQNTMSPVYTEKSNGTLGLAAAGLAAFFFLK